MIDLDLTDDQRLLERTVRDFVGRVLAERPRRRRASQFSDDGAAAPLGLREDRIPSGLRIEAEPAPRDVSAHKGSGARESSEVRGKTFAGSENDVQRLRLIIGEDANRVVVTVAVRGDTVDVAMRCNDEAIVAALGRNLGTLDHALRARGLALGAGRAERNPSTEDDKRPRRHRRPSEDQS